MATHKILTKSEYYKLNFTKGIIMNIIGAIAALSMLITGHAPHRHGGSIMFYTGKGWGGLSLGIFSFVCKDAPERTKNHEFGHSIQNCLYGPAFITKVFIPSCKRYWKFTNNAKKGIPNTEAYDDAWFEGEATELGTKTIQEWNKK
jgi:hypothetical protein